MKRHTPEYRAQDISSQRSYEQEAHIHASASAQASAENAERLRQNVDASESRIAMLASTRATFSLSGCSFTKWDSDLATSLMSSGEFKADTVATIRRALETSPLAFSTSALQRLSEHVPWEPPLPRQPPWAAGVAARRENFKQVALVFIFDGVETAFQHMSISRVRV
jgi:hypothetical protein